MCIRDRPRTVQRRLTGRQAACGDVVEQAGVGSLVGTAPAAPQGAFGREAVEMHRVAHQAQKTEACAFHAQQGRLVRRGFGAAVEPEGKGLVAPARQQALGLAPPQKRLQAGAACGAVPVRAIPDQISTLPRAAVQPGLQQRGAFRPQPAQGLVRRAPADPACGDWLCTACLLYTSPSPRD